MESQGFFGRDVANDVVAQDGEAPIYNAATGKFEPTPVATSEQLEAAGPVFAVVRAAVGAIPTIETDSATLVQAKPDTDDENFPFGTFIAQSGGWEFGEDFDIIIPEDGVYEFVVRLVFQVGTTIPLTSSHRAGVFGELHDVGFGFDEALEEFFPHYTETGLGVYSAGMTVVAELSEGAAVVLGFVGAYLQDAALTGAENEATISFPNGFQYSFMSIKKIGEVA